MICDDGDDEDYDYGGAAEKPWTGRIKDDCRKCRGDQYCSEKVTFNIDVQSVSISLMFNSDAAPSLDSRYPLSPIPLLGFVAQRYCLISSHMCSLYISKPENFSKAKIGFIAFIFSLVIMSS